MGASPRLSPRCAATWAGTRPARALETRALITPLVEALVRRARGLASREVYDGGANDPALKDFSLDDPAGLARSFKRAGPAQNPGGTRSQAWSVAEILRLLARWCPGLST